MQLMRSITASITGASKDRSSRCVRFEKRCELFLSDTAPRRLPARSTSFVASVAGEGVVNTLKVTATAQTEPLPRCMSDAGRRARRPTIATTVFFGASHPGCSQSARRIGTSGPDSSNSFAVGANRFRRRASILRSLGENSYPVAPGQTNMCAVFTSVKAHQQQIQRGWSRYRFLMKAIR